MSYDIKIVINTFIYIHIQTTIEINIIYAILEIKMAALQAYFIASVNDL